MKQTEVRFCNVNIHLLCNLIIMALFCSGHENDDDMEGVGSRRPTLEALGLEPEGSLCTVPSKFDVTGTIYKLHIKILMVLYRVTLHIRLLYTVQLRGTLQVLSRYSQL